MGFTELDSLEHDTTSGADNSLIKIDDTHFMLAYSQQDAGTFNYDHLIKTFSVDGSFNITEIDSLAHDTTGTSNSGSSSLIKIDSTHFALAYSGAGSDGFIKIFTIDGSYLISETSSLEHDTANSGSNSLVLIDSTHFILAYSGVDSDGFIKTFSIDGSYNITEIDSLEHDTTLGSFNSLVKIDSTHFALSYMGFTSSFIVYLKTFSIDGSYLITQEDSYTYNAGTDGHCALVLVDSTHLMAVANNSGTSCEVKTFSLDGSYNITEIDSLTTATNSNHPSWVNIDNTNFILARRDFDGGKLVAFSVDGSYNITEGVNLNHDSANSFDNSLVDIDGTNFIFAYRGTDNDGFIKTFSFITATFKPHLMMI